MEPVPSTASAIYLSLNKRMNTAGQSSQVCTFLFPAHAHAHGFSSFSIFRTVVAAAVLSLALDSILPPNRHSATANRSRSPDSVGVQEQFPFRHECLVHEIPLRHLFFAQRVNE
jgi:hypothetical protein